MKSLVAAIILILTAICIIWVNSYFLDNLLDYTEEKFEIIPKTLRETEGMTPSQKKKIFDVLKDTEKKWKQKETFLCLSLKHNTGREFSGYLISAISYFESEEYPEFLAQLASARDTLEHIKYDESLKLGNIL